MALPTLHSFTSARWEGNWVLFAGRTNGLHGFAGGGLDNFPPAYQNREVWVIDPVSKASWRRSLTDGGSGLTAAQIDSLSPTNMQFSQQADRLYVTGGYGYDTAQRFITYDTLSAIDLPELVAWAQGGPGDLTGAIRQLRDPLFQVTGGYMDQIGDRMHLIFAHNFQGGYTSGRNGQYTQQVRSFTIVDEGGTLSIGDPKVTVPDPNYRRRDFNVAPMLDRREDGSLRESFTAFSGVFTEADGAWTVPVEITADGTPTMCCQPVHSVFARRGIPADLRQARPAIVIGGERRVLSRRGPAAT